MAPPSHPFHARRNREAVAERRLVDAGGRRLEHEQHDLEVHTSLSRPPEDDARRADARGGGWRTGGGRPGSATSRPASRGRRVASPGHARLEGSQTRIGEPAAVRVDVVGNGRDDEVEVVSRTGFLRVTVFTAVARFRSSRQSRYSFSNVFAAAALVLLPPPSSARNDAPRILAALSLFFVDPVQVVPLGSRFESKSARNVCIASSIWPSRAGPAFARRMPPS